MKIETTKILEEAALFSLTRRSWGNSRQADKSKLKTSEDKQDDEKTKRRITVSKRLIDNCPQLDAIYEELGDLYHWCLGHSMQSCLREGVYFVRKSMILEFEERIENATKRIEEILVPEFLSVYHEAIDNARDELNGYFRAEDYPSIREMAAKFGIRHAWLEFNVPKDLPEDVKKREAKKLREQMDTAVQEMVCTLRESFASFVEELSRRLEVKPGTTGKRFTAPGAIDNLKDFISRFNSLNMANDTELAAAVAKARELVETKDAGNVAHSEQSRQRIIAAVGEVKKTCAALIEDMPARRFNLE